MLIFWKRLLAMLSIFLLVSCGGSGALDNSNAGGSGDDTTGGTGDDGSGDDTDDSPEVVVADLEVATSARQLNSDGQVPVIISAIAKDEKNNVLPQAVVSFAVNDGATIAPDAATAAGSVKTAQLTPGLNRPDNRMLTVTITSGDQERTLDIEVTGTTTLLDGPSNIVIDVPTTFTAKLRDSAGEGLAYQLITVTSSMGNTLTPLGDQGFQTDANGEVQFTMRAALGGSDTLMVSALGATYTKDVDISGDEFALISGNEEIVVNTPETVALTWKLDGVAQANKVIDLTATRGDLSVSSVTTNVSGEADFTISSGKAGGSVISAVTRDTGVTTTLTREFIATTPKYLNLQVEKSVLAPLDTTTITALVRDVDDNPVKNTVVTFNLQDTINGSLNSSMATTDSFGRASVVYTAGNATSADDGVEIKAEVNGSSGVEPDTVYLTVGSRALRIVLGDDEKLIEDDPNYRKWWAVIVTDANGNPVSNQEVDLGVVPTEYYKGFYSCETDAEGAGSWKWTPTAPVCTAEDLDYDGNLDTVPDEDYNGNGSLEPTNPVTVASPVITNEEGVAKFEIIYPQSEASWVVVKLSASVGVSGTEYGASSEFLLPVLADDVASCDLSPPNRVSPYGIADSCENPN